MTYISKVPLSPHRESKIIIIIVITLIIIIIITSTFLIFHFFPHQNTMFVYRVIILFLVFKWLFFFFNILTRAWTACCHSCSARLLDSILVACSNPAESGRVPAYKASTCRTWTCTWAATNRVRWSASDPEPSSLSLAPRRFLHKNSKTHINLIHHTITRRRSGTGTPVTHSELILLLRLSSSDTYRVGLGRRRGMWRQWRKRAAGGDATSPEVEMAQVSSI